MLKKLPVKEWWCGCEPTIGFANFEEFIRHMKDEHKTWYVNVFPKLLKKLSQPNSKSVVGNS